MVFSVGGAFISPYSYRVHKQTLLQSAMAIQVSRTPWASVWGIRWEIKKVILANNQTTQMDLRAWDQDLTNSSPLSRGSSGGPLLIFHVAASATSGVYITNTYDQGVIPVAYFGSGVTVQPSGPATINGHVAMELEAA